MASPLHLCSAAAVVAAAIGFLSGPRAQQPALIAPPPAAAPRFDVGDTLAALRELTDAADADRTVAGAAWTLLAFLENGATMKAGADRARVRQLTQWLFVAQDPQGRFAPDGVACNRTDQIVATLALFTAQERSNHRPFRAMTDLAVTAIEQAMQAPGAAPATPEEAGLLAHLASMLAQIDKPVAKPELVTRCALLSKAAVKPHGFGKNRRADAALHLGYLLLGEPFPPELTVARCWPANLTGDPLHTLFGVLAVQRTPPKTRIAQNELLGGLLAARVLAGDHVGTWPAAGGFDAATTTAILAMAVGIANGPPAPATAAAIVPGAKK